MVSVETGKKSEKKKGKKAVKDGVKKKVKERLLKKGGGEKKKTVTFEDGTAEPSVDSLISEIRGQVDEQQKDDSTPVSQELETLLAEDEHDDVAEGHSELLEKFGVKEKKRAPKEKTLPMEPTGMEIEETGKKSEKKKGKKAVKDGVKKKVKERLLKKGGGEKKKTVTFEDETAEPSVDSLISEIRGQVDEQQKDDSTPVSQELETLLAEDEHDDVAEGHSELLEKFGVKEKKRAPKEKTLPMEPTGMEIEGKVTLNELLVSASKQQNLTSVQQLLDSGKELTTLSEPLPRFQQEQAERIVNYDKTKKEVSKWQSLSDPDLPDRGPTVYNIDYQNICHLTASIRYIVQF
eukprot:sb/3466233/